MVPTRFQGKGEAVRSEKHQQKPRGQVRGTVPGSPTTASQDAGVPKEGKAKKKKSGTPDSLCHKDKVCKKEKGKKEKDPARPRGKEKVCADKKLPPSSPRGKAQGPEGTKKKPSSVTTVASSGKGMLDRTSSTGPQDSGHGPGALLTWKGGRAKKMPLGKLVEHKAPSLDEGAPQDTPRLKKQTLSHSDIFGAESKEENSGLGAGAPRFWPLTLPSMSSDSESDSNSSLGLDEMKVPNCLKTAPPVSSAPTSPLFSSSSSSESPESSGASQCAEEDVDYPALEKEVDFHADPMEECLGIFTESTNVKMEDKDWLAKLPPKDKAEKMHTGLTTSFPRQKRRVSHLCKPDKEAEAPKKTPVAPAAQPPTAQEVWFLRGQQALRESDSWLQAAPGPTEGLSSVHISVPGEKRTIAHIPNLPLAAALTGSKRVLPASSSQVSHSPEPGSQPLKTCTLSGMVTKTTTTVIPKAIAHSPSLQSLKQPVIPKEFGGKVSTLVRQSYLQLFLEECLKFCSSKQEAIEKALNEEKVAYDLSPSMNIYLNMAVNTLKKLRGLVPNTMPNLSKASSYRAVSHEVVLGDKLAARTSFSLNSPSSPQVEELRAPIPSASAGSALYSQLREYLLTQEQLEENGYPFPHPERPGAAVIFTSREKKPKDPSCRICRRCGIEFPVSSSGRCERSAECFYHCGRLQRNQVFGDWEYTCCSALVGSVGCQVAKQHVYDGRRENLEGFVRTFQKELPKDAHAGVFALDCEMSYTTYGLEVTRVTVVDTDLQVVYDTFVKPDNEVVDYNTRFSGVTEADLVDTNITLRDVQAILLSMFSADTILIGHSLENDLLALKVIHSTVVDTSVMFPHRLGLPYKRSLRNLMDEYLRQIIQNNVNGHSSTEDASACMKLVLWKNREDTEMKQSLLLSYHPPSSNPCCPQP